MEDISKIKKSCGRKRDKTMYDREEQNIYNASYLYTDTMYCHHYDENGKHIVLNKLDITSVCKCKGVFYYNIISQKMKCKPARNENLVVGGHDLCNEKNCPYIRDYGICPYMNNS